MPTRREVLLTLTAGAASLPGRQSQPAEIHPEAHCLSQESASGYQLLLNGKRANVWILPGVRDLSEEHCIRLRKESKRGVWLLLESGSCFCPPEHAVEQAAILQRVFGLRVLPPIPATVQNVEYRWPVNQKVRSFQALTPVACESHEAIAWHQGLPVCTRKTLGKGGVIYLGTMLGPGLFASEREAHQLGRALIKTLA